MGIWTTVRIIGTCDAKDVPALRKGLTYNRDTFENFHCLVNGGICGLPNWAGENINAIGNLAERGYNADSVAEQLDELAKVAPSLRVKVHVGEPGEQTKCAATVTLDGGNATVGPPEVDDIGSIPESQMNAQLMRAIYGNRC